MTLVVGVDTDDFIMGVSKPCEALRGLDQCFPTKNLGSLVVSGI